MSTSSDEGFSEAIALAGQASEFLAQYCATHVSDIQSLVQATQNTLTREELEQTLSERLSPDESVEQWSKALREFRNQHLFQIAWRDIFKLATITDSFAALSVLADVCLCVSCRRLYDALANDLGAPVDVHDQPLPLMIIALGKLGGEELNFSSDLDLMFVTPEAKPDQTNHCSVSGEQFFTRLVQSLVQLISDITEHGFVYRVDLRLRPHGTSGPIIMDLRQLEHYYQQHGRDWERYALIKARVVNDVPYLLEHRFFTILKPFVYRRYVDYGAIDALRDMKTLLERDMQTKGLESDIKRGVGGIRQIEFFTQVFQLLRGGQDRYLQNRQLLPTLKYLFEKGEINETVYHELKDAYIFLRHLEQRLQLFADQQTHTLPSKSENLKRLATTFLFETSEHLMESLKQHQAKVQIQFDKILKPKKMRYAAKKDPAILDLQSVWSDLNNEEHALSVFSQIGFEQADEIIRQLRQFKESRRCRTLSKKGRARLDEVMPLLLKTLSDFDEPSNVLKRLIRLLESIVKRSVYVSLLIENSEALRVLLSLFERSERICDLITAYPILLDELFHAPNLKSPNTEVQLKEALEQRLLCLPETDFEVQMEVFRRFKWEQILRSAAADLNRTLTKQQISEHLSATASVILQAAVPIAIQSLRLEGELHQINDFDFLIVAYGKLGSEEMNFGSDLDLVFLHDQQFDNEAIYLRLAQRLIHILNTRTASGILYEVDTRLRPSGASGLLVSSFSAFEHYQLENAWTWEHQALVRARAVTGPKNLITRFEAMRAKVLSQKRDLIELDKSIVEMRERMREAKIEKQDIFHGFAQENDALIDREFAAQRIVLAYSHEYPELLHVRHTEKIFELAEALVLT